MTTWRSKGIISTLVLILASWSSDHTLAQSKAKTEEQSKSKAASPASSFFKQAFDLMQAKEFDAARRMFEKGFGSEKGDAQAYFYYAETLVQLQQRRSGFQQSRVAMRS